MPASRPWNILPGDASNLVPETAFFEGESAFGKYFGLSKKARLQGFIACVVIGFISSLLGTIVLIFGQLVVFAVLYVLGTIITLLGTGFLIGFLQQLKLMFKPVRVVASAFFIASIVLVLVGAFVLGNGILCLIFVIVEFLAYTWYTMSYIPYARAAFTKAVGLG